MRLMTAFHISASDALSTTNEVRGRNRLRSMFSERRRPKIVPSSPSTGLPDDLTVSFSATGWPVREKISLEIADLRSVHISMLDNHVGRVGRPLASSSPCAFRVVLRKLMLDSSASAATTLSSFAEKYWSLMCGMMGLFTCSRQRGLLWERNETCGLACIEGQRVNHVRESCSSRDLLRQS